MDPHAQSQIILEGIRQERLGLEKERDSLVLQLQVLKHRLAESRAVRDKYQGAKNLLERLQQRYPSMNKPV